MYAGVIINMILTSVASYLNKKFFWSPCCFVDTARSVNILSDAADVSIVLFFYLSTFQFSDTVLFRLTRSCHPGPLAN